MKKLDWRPDATLGSLSAESRTLLDRIGHPREYVVVHTTGFVEMWAARLDGKELARGSLPECLEACEKSEAAAAVPPGEQALLADGLTSGNLPAKSAAGLIAKTADGQPLTPAELGLPTELPDTVVQVSREHAMVLGRIVNRSISRVDWADLGVTVDRDCPHYIATITQRSDAVPVVLRPCPGVAAEDPEFEPTRLAVGPATDYYK